MNTGLNRIGSKLLPVEHLHSALDIASIKHGLIPIFESSDVEFYYPLLEATLTHTSIIVHIPMKSLSHFNIWKLIPFPFLVNNSLLVIENRKEVILLSDDKKYIGIGDSDILENCKSSYLKLYVCPAYTFVFIPAEEASCELALVNDNVNLAIKACKFTPVNLRSVFHAHMNARQFFYFPNKTDVTFTCGKTSLLRGSLRIL